MKVFLFFVAGGLALVGGLWWIVARLSEAERQTEWFG
jgi:hypothetical protein